MNAEKVVLATNASSKIAKKKAAFNKSSLKCSIK
jgi:hypothetical protein